MELELKLESENEIDKKLIWKMQCQNNKVLVQANRGTGKNMATLNYKLIFFALTSEC
jgi:hypothetical protein